MAGLRPFALTSVENIKNHIDPNKDGQDDLLIESLINAFSKKAQERIFCNRKFVIDGYTEFYSGPRRHITLLAPPILLTESTPLEVWDDTDREYTNPSLRLIQYEDYDINEVTGIIRFETCLIGKVGTLKSIRVTYTGGLFGANDLENVPDDLRLACEQQVVFWFKHRNDPGMRQTDGQIGTNTSYNPTDILPNVVKTLLDYRRFD